MLMMVVVVVMILMINLHSLLCHLWLLVFQCMHLFPVHQNPVNDQTGKTKWKCHFSFLFPNQMWICWFKWLKMLSTQTARQQGVGIYRTNENKNQPEDKLPRALFLCHLFMVNHYCSQMWSSDKSSRSARLFSEAEAGENSFGTSSRVQASNSGWATLTLCFPPFTLIHGLPVETQSSLLCSPTGGDVKTKAWMEKYRRHTDRVVSRGEM